MRHLPEDDDDMAEARKMGAEDWMLDLLKLNPGYVSWGPHEDYMCTKAGDDSWRSSQSIATWSKFHWGLDDLNEVVNFYFQVRRASETCSACDGSGYNPDTKVISDTFYDHGSYRIDFVNMTTHGDAAAARRPRGATGQRWCDEITQDEVDALVAEGRLRHFDDKTGKWVQTTRTAAEVNAANREGASPSLGLNHDGINRAILIKTRATRLGVWGYCPACEGDGSVWTEDRAHASIVLWVIHPRKGASRGVEIEHLDRDDLPAVFAYLRTAAERNAARFAKGFV